MGEISFHVRHEVTPERVWGVFVAIAENYAFDHITQAERQLGRLRQLKLIETNTAELTTLGIDLYELGVRKEPLIWDFFHYLHYTQWSPEKVLEGTPFWSYRTHCAMLFSRVECKLDLPTRDGLTTELNNAINETFGHHLSQTKKGSVSLSTNSLSGIHAWLSALTPPVIESGKFSLRNFSSPELLILAIGSMMRENKLEQGVDILLSPDKREYIEKLCLIEDNCLDRILDWTMNLYPQFVTSGTRTGSYGRFIRMSKVPEAKDFIS